MEENNKMENAGRADLSGIRKMVEEIYGKREAEANEKWDGLFAFVSKMRDAYSRIASEGAKSGKDIAAYEKARDCYEAVFLMMKALEDAELADGMR